MARSPPTCRCSADSHLPTPRFTAPTRRLTTRCTAWCGVFDPDPDLDLSRCSSSVSTATPLAASMRGSMSDARARRSGGSSATTSKASSPSSVSAAAWATTRNDHALGRGRSEWRRAAGTAAALSPTRSNTSLAEKRRTPSPDASAIASRLQP
eukprot:scaffold3935_cov51-Phaeocystis_antarctica.AAC.1